MTRKTGKLAATMLNHDPLADIEALSAQRDAATQALSAPLPGPIQPIQHFDLGEFLVIQEVMSLFDTLKQILIRESVLQLEISRLERVDGAGVQLLCALVKEANTVGARIEWVGHSDALQESARRMGLASFLGFESPTGY
ncbi:putative STAS domain-containing protein [Gammaproteobacteria bacterium]